MENSDIKIIKDLSYSSQPLEKLDLYLPESCQDRETVLISLHGGSWSMGDKADYEKQTLEFAKRLRLPCVNMNYVMPCDESAFDGMIADVESAMIFVKSYCRRFDLDIKRCILRGFSAGAHIALCYACLKCETSPLKICFCIGESLPGDLTFAPQGKASSFVYRGMSNITGHRINSHNRDIYIPQLEKVSPKKLVSSKTPPVLMLHGEQDYIIGYPVAVEMLESLKKTGVPCELVTFPDSGHSLDKNPELVDFYFDRVHEFYKSYAAI